MIAGWTSIAENGLVHILPINDLVEHTVEEGCVCGPKSDQMHTSGQTLVVHFALDRTTRS